ncbi:MAG: potassium channel family protein [Armatimonadota bacterium]|jgi:trk system potassium uptake protein TrkA
MSKKSPMYVIVVGAGKVGYHLAKTLIQEGHEVLLLEKDRKTVEFFRDSLGELIVLGDGCEIRTMSEVGMGRANVVVAVTGDDEDNLVVCQMAKRKFGVPRTIARVNDPKNEGLFKELGIDQTLSSTRIIFNLLEQQIETGQVIPLAALKRGDIEVVEATITASSNVLGMLIKDVELPQKTLIISIIRDEYAIIPRSDTKFREGDSVIAIIKSEYEKDLRAVFE